MRNSKNQGFQCQMMNLLKSKIRFKNYFSKGFDNFEFNRKNRKKSKRIVNIAQDLSKPGISLNYIEKNEITKTFPTWKRNNPKVNSLIFSYKIDNDINSQKILS